ncbi:TonB-dependent receptor plug domain-containing protein [Polymorphobacter sp.]|uniref:TonB-dependent receptor plug domain-containing protein n=1 Tax=Polymorphobacter sp. TaxID=1909290 RepID=UPI003F72AAE7
MTLRTNLAAGSALLALAISQPLYAQTVADAAAAPEDADQIIVTGVRGQPRTIIASPTPIDVIGGEQLLQRSGGLQLRDVLSQLVPSFQSTTVGSSSFNSLTRPAGLRGLSGVHVLVLVNGKRRHNSSIIDFNTGATSVGGNPVDLDLIPASAIERIEVLRDGASAQYGTDAIAGVINVILKTNSTDGMATIEAGQRYGRDGSGSDGETIQASISKGFAVGNGGTLNLAVEAKSSQPTIRSGTVPRSTLFFDRLPGGVEDPREATVNRRTYLGGLPEVQEIKGALTAVIPTGDFELYSDGTIGYREARVGQAGRLPRSNQNILAVYPEGFSPFYTLAETDFQFTGGIRGKLGGWDLDFSSTYGRNYARNGADNSINASLGAASPTSFDTFSSEFQQWTNNLDLTRRYELGGEATMQVSAGAEFRQESYQTRALDPASYANGGYFYPTGSQAGLPAQVGAQGALVVTPADEADISRNVYAAYVDLAFDITPKFLVTAAGRFEHFDDSAGSVWSGKVSGRYEFTDWFAIRGALSNGFRAPALAQQAFAQTSTAINNVGGGVFLPIETAVVRVESVIGRALGAEPLRPEKSMNYSLGFTLTPLQGLSVAVDAYQIDLDNRITSTGLLTGAGVRAILAANGSPGVQAARYFTNAVDTRTRGVDVVAAYSFDTTSAGRFRTTLGFNYNETTIQAIAPNPSELAGLGLTLFDRRTQGFFTGTPRTKLILGVNWTLDRLNVNLLQTRYDKVTSLDNSPAADQTFGAKWITDLEVSYGLTENLRLAVGAYNLFDTYPDLATATNTIGLPPYGAGPFGSYGGYYYGRISFNF